MAKKKKIKKNVVKKKITIKDVKEALNRELDSCLVAKSYAFWGSTDVWGWKFAETVSLCVFLR